VVSACENAFIEKVSVKKADKYMVADDFISSGSFIVYKEYSY
jgi:hypothetical protein